MYASQLEAATSGIRVFDTSTDKAEDFFKVTRLLPSPSSISFITDLFRLDGLVYQILSKNAKCSSRAGGPMFPPENSPASCFRNSKITSKNLWRYAELTLHFHLLSSDLFLLFAKTDDRQSTSSTRRRYAS